MQWLDEHRVSAPLQAHVEGGKIVDYGEDPAAPVWETVEVKAPKDWTWSKDDLWDKDQPAFE